MVANLGESKLTDGIKKEELGPELTVVLAFGVWIYKTGEDFDP